MDFTSTPDGCNKKCNYQIHRSHWKLKYDFWLWASGSKGSRRFLPTYADGIIFWTLARWPLFINRCQLCFHRAEVMGGNKFVFFFKSALALMLLMDLMLPNINRREMKRISVRWFNLSDLNFFHFCVIVDLWVLTQLDGVVWKSSVAFDTHAVF